MVAVGTGVSSLETRVAIRLLISSVAVGSLSKIDSWIIRTPKGATLALEEAE